MKLASVALVVSVVVSILIITKGCMQPSASPPPRYPAPTAQPGGCDPGSLRNLQCQAGQEGAIVESCGPNRTWEVVSDTCATPTCSDVVFADVRGILTDTCVSCHPGYDEYPTAVGKWGNFLNRVKLPSSDPRHMPKGSDLAPNDIQLMEDFQRDGFKQNCTSTGQQGRRTLDDIESAILADLTNINPFERQFTRYFVGKPAFAGALAKSLNSLSLESNLRSFAAVNEELFRIQLDDYGFTEADWRVIEKFDDIGFESFSSKGQLIKGLVGTKLPWVHARNFNFVSHKTAVYYHLLRLPKTLDEFLALDFIDIDIDDEYERLRPRLLGFNGSPISLTKNRLIARFESAEGYMWFTYDVDNIEDAGKNLFENPLPEETGGKAIFNFVAGEVIFSLPNGLQGYILFNAAGKREDAAPLNIVFDTESPFEPEIANGLDCHRCHAKGLIVAEDQVRSSVERNAGQFDANDVALVQFLFPRVTSGLFAADNDFYKTALDQIAAYGEIDLINESTDYLRSDYSLTKAAELLFVSDAQMKFCVESSGALQATIGQLATGGTVSFDQLTQSLPQIFRDCGFNRELVYP